MLAKDVMSQPVVTVRPDTGIAEAGRLLTRLGYTALPVIDGDGGPVGMVTEHDLLRGRVVFDGLDLAYAAGLFDYLADQAAERLIAALLGMLAPGGRLLIANFAPDCYGSGYRDAIMDWALLYRDEAALVRLLDGLPPGTVVATRTYRDPHGNIAFLEAIAGGGGRERGAATA